MPGHDIIVVGASAGGVEALNTLARTLPARLAAAVFVVLHIPAQTPSMLSVILDRAGPLDAVQAEDNMKIENGCIYVAPPDHHMLVQDGNVRVVRGPKENRHRPAVDPLFRSAAQFYGPRVIGVVLTGALDDGTAGLLAIKWRGGIAVVQDPNDALYPSMPESALSHVDIDYTVPLSQLGPLLGQLAQEEAQENGKYPVPDDMVKETRLIEMDTRLMEHSNEHVGTPSAFSCPECGGVLWELQDSDLLRFRCRVGHAFSTESVMAEQSDNLEEALWVALKTIEESVELSRCLLQQAHEHGQNWLVKRYEEKLKDSEKRVKLIRQALIKSEQLVTSEEPDEPPKRIASA